MTRRLFGIHCAALPLLAQPSVKSGTIRLFGGIDAQTMANLANMVDQYIKSGITDLTLNISSPGGDVGAAISIYEYLKGRPLNITTHNFGTVDSAAVIIFAAGSKRLCSPLGRFVLHEPAVSIGRPVDFSIDQIGEFSARLKQESDAMATVISEITTKPFSVARGWLRDRVVWNAKVAVDNGLAHEVKSEISVTASLSGSIVGPLKQDSTTSGRK